MNGGERSGRRSFSLFPRAKGWAGGEKPPDCRRVIPVTLVERYLTGGTRLVPDFRR